MPRSPSSPRLSEQLCGLFPSHPPVIGGKLQMELPTSHKRDSYQAKELLVARVWVTQGSSCGVTSLGNARRSAKGRPLVPLWTRPVRRRAVRTPFPAMTELGPSRLSRCR